MFLAQTRIFAGPHNLLGLRGPANIRARAKRALLDPKWSFAIPSSVKIFSLSVEIDSPPQKVRVLKPFLH